MRTDTNFMRAAQHRSGHTQYRRRIERPDRASLFLRTLIGAIIAATIAVASGAGLLAAHSGKQSYLYVSLYDDGVEARVEIPAADLATVIGADIPNDVDGAEQVIRERSDVIRAYIAANTSLGDDDGQWTLDVGDDGRILDTESGLYVVYDVGVEEEFDGAPSTFVAEFSVIIESNPERDALLLIENDWASATFDNEGDHLLGFSVGMTEQVAVIENAPTLDAVGDVRGLGTDAVRTGIDLMLIVVALTLLAITGRGAEARVAAGAEVARRSARMLGVFLGGLTVSLWILGSGLVSLSDRVSGIVVAVTLGASAVLAIIGRFRHIPDRPLIAITAAVGVLHGLGLATVFTGFGLDRRRPVLGLIAFEAGAVIAIVILIACVVGPMLLLRDHRLGDLLTVGLGLALFAYACAWFGERLVSEDWPIEEIANPLRVWPRNLAFVAAAIAAAALARRVGRPIDSPAPQENPRP